MDKELKTIGLADDIEGYLERRKIKGNSQNVDFSRGYAHCLSNVMDWLLELEE